MLKIFHNNFFENLSDPIPPFFTTKKFGLLKCLLKALVLSMKLIYIHSLVLAVQYWVLGWAGG